MVVQLPNDIDDYRLFFEGEYKKATNYHSRNYVTIDNLELRSCSVEGKYILFHLISKHRETIREYDVQRIIFDWRISRCLKMW